MNRRTALSQITLLVGGAISTLTLAALNRFDQRFKGFITAGGFTLTQTQQQLFAVVTELIITRTDTPGAQNAGVPAFV